MTTTSFAALGVAPDLAEALAQAGITEPFAIQALVLRDALDGHDLCGKAKTGSGKTLAFGLPLLQLTQRAKPRRPASLVLVPTRELAAQVHEVLSGLGRVRGLRITAFYGGTPIERDLKVAARGVDIVVATPGRLIDLVERGALSLADVSRMTIDEADRMADMGFMPQVEWLLRHVEGRCQTMLFSATLDGDVDRLIARHMRDPLRHEVASSRSTVHSMSHHFMAVHQLDKPKVVAAIGRGAFRTLVFVRTKRGADRLTIQLRRLGIPAEALHGDLRQRARERSLARFSSGNAAVLVATDVAARGLDVEAIDVVVHFDPPADHKAYLHRSGRTARAGEAGAAVTLVLWNQVLEVERLQKHLGLNRPLVEVFSNDARLANLSSFGSSAAEAGAVA